MSRYWVAWHGNTAIHLSQNTVLCLDLTYGCTPQWDLRLQPQRRRRVADVKFRNIPLLYIAAFACGIGVFGCLWLWWAHRRNYVWVINRIFLPALMNSIAGLISTLVNIYSAQDGTYPTSSHLQWPPLSFLSFVGKYRVNFANLVHC